jgi:hypothetical protein
MGEKRGNTGKLLNPYNDNGVLEIYQHELEQWIRVTSTEFRSWGGKRRITEYLYPRGKDIISKTYEYEGPVFGYMTNTKIPKPVLGINGIREKSKSTYSEDMYVGNRRNK